MTFQFFPEPNIIAQIGPLTLHVYGAMYALAAIFSYILLRVFAKKGNLKLSKDDALDIVFWGFVVGVIGARIFYVFVYNFEYFREHIWSIFAVWKGGLSIHGGLLGGALGVIMVIKKKHLPMWEVGRITVPIIALGMMLGRLGNFANGELPGRGTAVPWAMDFGDGILRHPSQLYAAAKDLFLFIVFTILVLKTKISGKRMFGLFLMSYAILRFSVEFFREPDVQLGFVFAWLSMGQILSLFMFIIGVGLVSLKGRK